MNFYATPQLYDLIETYLVDPKLETFECRELLDLIQMGTLKPEVAFLDASLIPDVFPVLASAHKILVVKSRESLTTRTLHSELVYNYSGSKHDATKDRKQSRLMCHQCLKSNKVGIVICSNCTGKRYCYERVHCEMDTRADFEARLGGCSTILA